MTRRVGAALVVALAALAPVQAAAAARAPARLLVTASEFRLVLSRQSILAWPAVIQLANSGEDDHDLKLRRKGGKRVVSVSVTRPGGLAEIDPVLRAGTYRVWCSLADHAARGMVATLVVRPRRAG